MIKTRTWIIIIAVILVVSSGITIYAYLKPNSGKIANVYVNDVCVYSVDLSQIEETTYKVIVFDNGNRSTLMMEPGRICASSADCPDKVCVDMGWIGSSAAPIVCLPNKMVIRIEENAMSSDGFDSVAK